MLPQVCNCQKRKSPLFNIFLHETFQMREVSVLLGLMCKYSCEDCNLIIFDQFQERYIDVELDKGTILENMATVLEKNIGDVSKLL